MPSASRRCQRRERAEPAVLVVHGCDAARVRELDSGSHRLEVLLVVGQHVALLELPGRLLAQDAGRLALGVPLDDAARDLEVAVRERERGRVEPERVVVLGDQRRRAPAGHRVERLPRRLDASAPSRRCASRGRGASARRGSAAAASPARASASVEAPRAVERDLVLRDRPRREVDVRVVEARDDAAAAEVDGLGARERGLVRADPACDPVARDRERSSDGKRRLERADDPVLEDHRGGI